MLTYGESIDAFKTGLKTSLNSHLFQYELPVASWSPDMVSAELEIRRFSTTTLNTVLCSDLMERCKTLHSYLWSHLRLVVSRMV